MRLSATLPRGNILPRTASSFQFPALPANATGDVTLTYRAILFDLDGTLVDSFGAIHESLAVAMRGVGVPPWPYATTRATVGRGLDHLLEQAVGPDRKEAARALFREDYGATCADRTPTHPAVPEVLDALRAEGYTLAVATNKPLPFTLRILDHLKLTDRFACIGAPDETTRPKPHPDMIDAIRARIGVEAEACLYVGDIPLDAETASRAGVDCLLVASGNHDHAALTREAVAPVVERFSDIPGFLAGTNRP